MAKILVADDNSNIQKMVGLALKDQGIDVVAVGNGEAAVRKISDVRPDLVLADVFMPVRNGYEVCNYVKQDSALSHIPVILLVGAFDPLDEQEAQRVGADGVLKKPFVPPDPLISMVKSALTRAGVVLGASEPGKNSTAPAPPVPSVKPAPPPLPKIAPPAPAAEPEADLGLPSFASKPAPISIDKGEQPLAFGTLLETPAQEEETVFTIPGGAAAPDRDWGHNAPNEEEEIKEETSKTGSWRLSAIDDSPNEAPAGQVDWREAAFSGIGAETGDKHWAPSVEKNSLSITEEEAQELAKKQEPFSGPPVTGAEDWSKAIIDIFPEKPAGPPVDFGETPATAAETIPLPAPVVEPTPEEKVPEPELPALPVPAASPEPVEAPAVAPDPALNSWMAGAVSPWEAELQRASDLASSWDSVTIAPDAPVAGTEPVVPETEATQATQAFLDSGVIGEAQDHVVEAIEETKAEKVEGEFITDSEALSDTPSAYSSAPSELEERHKPAPVVESPVATPEPPEAAGNVSSPAPVAEPAPAPLTSSEMDELVAKVLAKMNPDVLQAVTREILRPVVEALVKDELNKK